MSDSAAADIDRSLAEPYVRRRVSNVALWPWRHHQRDSVRRRAPSFRDLIKLNGACSCRLVKSPPPRLRLYWQLYGPACTVHRVGLIYEAIYTHSALPILWQFNCRLNRDHTDVCDWLWSNGNGFHRLAALDRTQRRYESMKCAFRSWQKPASLTRHINIKANVIKTKTNKQPMGFDAQLAAFSVMTCTPSKLGQTDLVFGLWSEFINRSVHARIQLSTRLLL